MQQTNLSITTRCNRSCPYCCVRRGKPSHHPWEYFEHAAQYLHGIPVLHITGGEPTMHPQFERIVAEFPALFGCERMTIWTNGFGWPTHKDALKQFDLVQVSHYTASTYPGAEPNTATVQAMAAELDNLRIEDGLTHVPMEATGRTGACGRLRDDVVNYFDGLAYPCCVGPGPKSARGVELSDHFLSDLKQIAAPCETCGFAI